ncbi:hypothetical protein [Noviherbaspirillum saxi]|uniref:Uncharacterized protein n=1 Tax=Noviherbaspirillum saxi TaxID=2320863 RepID=A0A3A3FJY4_9BURK|nr:hypothetical protein [Noviherbaspirillum saxi]RJF95813.1 hypothetical protein D3871_20790 [Noviherbaspirillum saxi]
MSLDYVNEKLSAAVHALAVGEGDVRSRLITAYMCFSTLRTADFPSELQSDYEWIMGELTKEDPVVDYNGDNYKGSVEATLGKMQNRTAAHIAARVYSLQLAAREKLYAQGKDS